MVRNKTIVTHSNIERDCILCITHVQFVQQALNVLAYLSAIGDLKTISRAAQTIFDFAYPLVGRLEQAHLIIKSTNKTLINKQNIFAPVV